MLFLDTATGKEKFAIPIHEKNAEVVVNAYSPDGKLMLVSRHLLDKPNDWKNYQYRLDLLDTASGKEVASVVAAKNESFAGYFSPDGTLLALDSQQSKEQAVHLFSVAEKRIVKTIAFAKSAPNEKRQSTKPPVFSPDGKWLALITRVWLENPENDADVHDMPQPRIHLIETATGTIRQTLIAPQGFCESACFSPTGRPLAVASHGRVLLWDVSHLSK